MVSCKHLFQPNNKTCESIGFALFGNQIHLRFSSLVSFLWLLSRVQFLHDDSGLNYSAAAIWFTLGFVRTAALPNNLWCSAKMLLVFGPDERGNDVGEIDLVASEVSPLLGPCSMCTTLHKLSLTFFKFSITSPSVLSTMFVYGEQITWFVLAGSKSAVHAFLMSRRTSMSRPPSF